MLSPLSFTGMKNIGYARVLIDDNIKSTRVCMNMELTDDKCGKDLAKYKKVIAANPMLKNEINDNFVNLEFQTLKIGNGISGLNIKMNGESILDKPNKMSLLNYMKALVNRVVNMKKQDFKIDEDYNIMKEAQEGLIYKEDIVDYLDVSAGKVDFLEDSGLIEKFDLYLNDENIYKSERDIEKVLQAADDIVGVLHEPDYVHKGSIYMEALLKGYSNFPTSS